MTRITIPCDFEMLDALEHQIGLMNATGKKNREFYEFIKLNTTEFHYLK